MKILLPAFAIATAGLLTAGAVVAAEQTQPRTQVVEFSDLDLSHNAGAVAVYRRVAAAARSVCRDLDARHELWRKSQYQNCVQRAVIQAIAEIDHPNVTRYVATHPVDSRGHLIGITRS